MTRLLRIQLVAFLLIAAVGVSYVASTYVGLGRLLGLTGYEISVTLPRTGGLFDNAEVTYRGVPVGRVEELTATPEGVTVRVVITEEDVEIPRDVEPFVRNRSAIGEQYLDLRPRTGAGDALREGDRLTADEAHLPMPLDDLLVDVIAFNDSLPTEDLKTVVDEMYAASLGAGDDVGILLAESIELIDIAEPRLDVTTSLIDRAAGVLTTQAATSQSLRSFSADLRLIARTLADNDASVRGLLVEVPAVSREATSLLAEAGQPASALIANLVSLNGVLAQRLGELRTVLDRVPTLVQTVDRILGPVGVRLGLTTNFTDPLPCTHGYTQPRRGPEDTGDVPLRESTGCSGGGR